MLCKNKLFLWINGWNPWILEVRIVSESSDNNNRVLSVIKSSCWYSHFELGENAFVEYFTVLSILFLGSLVGIREMFVNSKNKQSVLSRTWKRSVFVILVASRITSLPRDNACNQVHRMDGVQRSHFWHRVESVRVPTENRKLWRAMIWRNLFLYQASPYSLVNYSYAVDRHSSDLLRHRLFCRHEKILK